MRKPKNHRFTCHSDPGHGWLCVNRPLLLQFPNAALAISAYSYQRGAAVYLEQDCDCQVFLEALRARGDAFVIVERVCNEQSRIRSYERFQLSAEEIAACQGSAA